VLNFNECNTDTDCAGRAPDGGGALLFCTPDHFCVDGLPEQRLCMPPMGAPIDGKTTVIAGLFRLSGPADSKDTAMADAAVLAMQEVAMYDQQRPIALVMCDTAGDSSNGVRALERAVSVYGAVAAVGPTTSSNVLAVAPIAAMANVLIVSPSATSPSISSLPERPFIWRTAASDTLQATVLAKQPPIVAPSPPPLFVNVAYVDTAYGVGLDEAFIMAWANQPTLGSTVKFAEGSDPTVPINKLAQENPTVSVLIADADAAALVGSLSTNQPAALSKTQFLMTDGAKGLDLFGAVPNPQVLSRIRGTAPGAPSGTTFSAFNKTYQAEFNQDARSTSFVANTYDAFYVIAIAIGATPAGMTPNGTTLAANVKRLSNPAPAAMLIPVGPAGYLAAVNALLGGTDVNLDGTSGPIDFNPMTGDVLSAPIEVWAIDVTNPSMPAFKTLQTVTP
jgi:ABC-type branched-subunit amino acid transport system substrate-binding protein